MMTEEQEDCSMQVIDFCRRHFRKLGAEQFAAKLGARPDDISIGAIYAAVDLAQHHTGDTASAIAWAREALDMLEGTIGPEVTVQ
jgi:hypothetical protein